MGVFLTLAAVAWLLPPVESIELTPDRDNTLVESPSGSLSNGQGGSIFCGRTGQPANSVRRALVHFDLAALPAGAVIESVSLRMSLTSGTTLVQDCSLFPVERAWGEGASNAGPDSGGMGAPAEDGDATWLHTFHDTDFWTHPGGDFAAAASATLAVGELGETIWSSTPELAADVQGWLDDPRTHHGWLLMGNESSGGTSKRFASREALDETTHPVLSIEYSLPPGVPATGTPGLVLLGLVLTLGGFMRSHFARGLEPGARARRSSNSNSPAQSAGSETDL